MDNEPVMHTHSQTPGGDVSTGNSASCSRRFCTRKLTDVVEEVSVSTVKISKETMALESRITQEEIKKEPEKPIDREKVDYMLLSTSWFTCILISH